MKISNKFFVESFLTVVYESLSKKGIYFFKIIFIEGYGNVAFVCSSEDHVRIITYKTPY